MFGEEPPMNEDLRISVPAHDGQRRADEEIVDELINLANGQKISGAMNADKLNILK